MEPSKEAIEAVVKSYFGYISTSIVEHILKPAYAIDVAPLEKRLEDAENNETAERVRYIFEKATADHYRKELIILNERMENNTGNYELQLKDARNAALEEAAQLFDNLVKSSNWNPADLEFFAVKIRTLKEG